MRTQIDELNAEMAVMRAEADRALDRLNKQVEARSAEVLQAGSGRWLPVGRAERAEAGRDAERAEADALRPRSMELRAGQAMMIDMHARELALAQHDALAAQQAAAELPAVRGKARKARGLVARLRAAWRGE